MYRKNIVVRFIGSAARKFRVAQELWILPWWGEGRFAAAPLWAMDTFVLVVKLFSTCAMAVVKALMPPILKSLDGETVLVSFNKKYQTRQWITFKHVVSYSPDYWSGSRYRTRISFPVCRTGRHSNMLGQRREEKQCCRRRNQG